MRSDSLHLAIREILLNDWDPIGVRTIANTQDEYDQYVEPVAAMLAAAQPEARVARYLLEIERESMGLMGNETRARMAAKKLAGVRDLRG